MQTKPVIITVCGDPGGANAIAPVIAMLERGGKITVINYAYNEGIDVLKRQQIQFTSLSGKSNLSSVLELFESSQPRLLLTATSANESNWETCFILAAQQLNVHSVAVLDFWSNYTKRFSDSKGDLVFLPNKIAVMDEYAKAEMIAAGIPAEQIMITGQPAFDSLGDCYRAFSTTKKTTIRESLSVQPAGLLVTFLSQPLRKLYQDANYLGFDEIIVIEKLIETLEIISQKHQKPITLHIRPHPREKLQDYERYQSSKIHIVASVTGESRDYLMSSDLIVGMNTVLLIEACYLNCVVASLQPGLLKKDVLPTNAYGATVGIYKEEEITPMLEILLFDQNKRKSVLEKTAMLALARQSSASYQLTSYIYSTVMAN